jgi:hypothetical protein
MKKSNCLLIMSFSVLIFCYGQKPIPHNEELAKAAKDGQVFKGKDYFIITEPTTVLRLEGIDTLRKTLQRGDVFEKQNGDELNGYSLVILKNDINKWNLKSLDPNSEGNYIDQYSNTPFPIIGIIQKNTTLGYFDFEAKGERKMKLKKGTLYFWVIKKEGHYVNVVDAKGKSRTGYLDEEKLNLVQKEDHLKIMSEIKRKSLEKLWQ